jgi:hypothetical protein
MYPHAQDRKLFARMRSGNSSMKDRKQLRDSAEPARQNFAPGVNVPRALLQNQASVMDSVRTSVSGKGLAGKMPKRRAQKPASSARSGQMTRPC